MKTEQERFHDKLEELVGELTGPQIMAIPGAYEVFSERIDTEDLEKALDDMPAGQIMAIAGAYELFSEDLGDEVIAFFDEEKEYNSEKDY